MDAAYPATAGNTPTRNPERVRYDRAIVHAVLDEALVCHLGYVRDGKPVVIPTIHTRIGERLYLHGSKGAAVSRAAKGVGVAVCVTATVVDGLVLARSAFQHSMNYRSVVLHGTAEPVADEAERSHALDAVVDHVWPGRSGACRKPTAKELRATSVLVVDLLEVSAKCRAGDPVDKPGDLDGPWWAGVVPVHTVYADPEPAVDRAPGARGPDRRDGLVTDDPLFGLDELAAAGRTVASAMGPTPQLSWPLLRHAIDAEVWVKHENHTPIGAFKVRGGLVHLDRLAHEPDPPAGVVSATRGNHGQSLAYAALVTGTRAVVVVPEGNNPEKDAAMRAFGAEVIVAGRDFDEARGLAATLADERDLRMVPPFHRDLVLGVATYAFELLTAVADLDAVYVPIGMGSGIVGLITVRDLLALRTEIVGVVAEGAPASARSFAAGRVETTDRVATFVDGVACREPDSDAMAHIVRGAARVLTIPDAETADAMRLLLRCTHNLTEPAGAIGLAALLRERELQRGRRIAIVLSGGNVDAPTLATVLAGGTPAA